MYDPYLDAPMQVYLREQYPDGGPLLSVVVGSTAYCEPRENFLPRRQYTHVEVALLNEDGFIPVSEWLPDAHDRDDTVVSLSVQEMEAVQSGLRRRYGDPIVAEDMPWPLLP